MIELSAQAKINWTLDICGKRADGYHLLDSVMQSVSLGDTVRLEKAADVTVDCSVSSIVGQENIAAKAAHEFFSQTGISSGVSIFIEKKIPLAAGMGGGSADAAAVLVGLNMLYETNLSKEELCKIGLSVGADVPFCIVGGTARVGGIGEVVEPLPSVEGVHLLLIKNGEKRSTREMYQKIDEQPIRSGVTAAAVRAVLNGDTKGLLQNLGNDFEGVSGLYGVDKLFAQDKPLALGLSGSGPTVFAAFENEPLAQKAFERLKTLGVEVYRAVPVNVGVSVIE